MDTGCKKKKLRLSSSPAAAPASFRSLIAQILGRILVKGLLASWGAEVVSLVLVVALDLRRLLVDGHLAYRIYSHFFILQCAPYALRAVYTF